MKVGDKVERLVPILDERFFVLMKRMEGTVVYVHPDNLYYTLEFKTGSGKYNESFFFD